MGRRVGAWMVSGSVGTEGAGIIPPDAPLRLTVGGRRWTVPRACVVGVTEAETPTPLPAPLRIGLPGLVGVVGVNGDPVVCADPCEGGGAAPGRMLVVVTTAVGRVALRVDDARWDREGEANAVPLELAAQLPWSGGARVASLASRPSVATAAAPSGWSLLRVIHDGAALVLRADRLERIERAELVAPLPESAGWLVAVDGALLPARRLSGPTRRRMDDGTEESGAVHAVVLRGDRPDERAALLVERVVSVERGLAAALFTVRHPEGGESLWWRGMAGGGAPLRVIDPAPLFGWAVSSALDAAPINNGQTDAARASGSFAAATGRCLLVERAGVTLAVPLASVAQVAESGHDGPADRLRLVGPGRWRRRALRVDRINALPGGPGGGAFDDLASPWRPIDGLPPALAALFDAARRDPKGDRWILRVRAAADAPGLPLPVAARRCLVAAWRDWVAPPPAAPAAALACATPSPIPVAPKPSVIASS